MKEERKEGRKESNQGRKEGRKESNQGRTEGRKQGRNREVSRIEGHW